MAGECPGRRSPPAGSKPVGKLSLLVGLAESLSTSSSAAAAAAAAEGSSRSPTPRSPRNFDYDGAVGLGIVAAMNDGGQEAHPWGAPVTRTPRPAPPTRSVPIPIVSATAGFPRRKEWREEEEMELSESYTCVISLVGAAAVRKRVYFEDGTATCWGGCSAVLYETPPPPARPSLLPAAADDFLSRCFRCRKKLHGVDIFMYRGDKAFCSAECRCQQMISDEHREKCVVPDALKPFDCSSASPCSTPLFFAAGVAAA